MKGKGISIGTRVKVSPHHWLRAYEYGVVVDFQPGPTHNWLVRFDRSYPGGGIEGDKLWLDQSQFSDAAAEGSLVDGDSLRSEEDFFDYSRRNGEDEAAPY
jgi:hypothetical protein